ncbi:MAG: N-6 DNA methylase [bacterium]
MDIISLYKNRIDALMDILFGAGVSNPQTIIEQLNYLLFLRALSIKDDEAELLGITDESEKIFTGELAKYRWQNLLALNAEDLFKTLETSFDLLQKKSKNPTVKLLFRNAHIKIFDKPTLRRILHEIETFSKELDAIAHEGNKDVFGDMYEYLLSKLSSAGTNGQFRTPRHIIDFMVKVVDPKKNETILDPACGTAGFLVAAYRYIAGEYTSDKLKKAGSPRAMDKLSADEKNFLFNHMFTGFDSDEDMIKFGMMNLHLHGLTKSRLVRQNSLTDTSGIKDKFDVILANPPFAGKIDEESVTEDLRMGTKATELLFLRFMMDHLSSKGKLAVIIPEGVITNSTKTHIKIREMLLESGLWCVVSLPGGVFNPYAGVKTDILFIDKQIAQKTNKIIFTQIGNDGFDLGAQRRQLATSDLPNALTEIQSFKDSVIKNEEPKMSYALTTAVPRQSVLDTSDLSLYGDRYRVRRVLSKGKWPLVALEKLCTLQRGISYSTPQLGDEGNGMPLYNLKSIKRDGDLYKNDFKYFTGEVKDKHLLKKGDLLIALTDLTPSSELIGSPKFVVVDFPTAYSADLGKVVFSEEGLVDSKYLYYLLRSSDYRNYIVTYSHGANVKHLKSDGFYRYEIPLPPISEQKKMVVDLEREEGQIKEKEEEVVQLKESIKQKIAQIWSA